MGRLLFIAVLIISLSSCASQESQKVDTGSDKFISGHSYVWTGSEVLVVGGLVGDVDIEPVLPAPLLRVSRSGSVQQVDFHLPGLPKAENNLVWTGSEVFAFSGRRDGDPRLVGAFDPTSLTWREMDNVEIEERVYSADGFHVDGVVAVAGGLPHFDSALGQIMLFELASGENKSLNVPGIALDITASNGTFYVLSRGVDGSDFGIPSVWRINPQSGEVELAATLDLERDIYNGGIVDYKGQVFVWLDDREESAGLFELASGELRRVDIEAGDADYDARIASHARRLEVVEDWIVTGTEDHLRFYSPSNGDDRSYKLSDEESCAFRVEIVSTGDAVFGLNTCDGERQAFFIEPPN